VLLPLLGAEPSRLGDGAVCCDWGGGGFGGLVTNGSLLFCVLLHAASTDATMARIASGRMAIPSFAKLRQPKRRFAVPVP
jgi:hypothetical protein